jgi:hypothetical protein
MGVGNGPLSVDGHLLRNDGGGPSVWLYPDTVLHQINDQLWWMNIDSGNSGNLGHLINECASAETGEFLAWGSGIGLVGAITTPSGGLSRVVTDGRGTAARDGCLVFTPNRADDNGPTIVKLNSREHHLPTRYGLHVLGWERAVWNESGGRLGFWNQQYAHLNGASYAKLAELNGEIWITYFAENIGLISHKGINPDVYYVISNSDHVYHHDVVVVDGRLIVAFSTTTGEGPDHLAKHPNVLDLPACPYEETEVPLDPITPVNRKVWLGSFDRYNNGSFPGNCWLDDKTNPNHVERHDNGEWLYYYTAGNPDGDADAIVRAVDDIKARINHGELDDLPIIAYVPHGVALPWNADVIGVECYWKKPLGETIEAFEQSRRDKITQANRPCILIPQTYFSNANNAGHTEANRHEIQEIAPVISRLLAERHETEGAIAFSAGDWRGTGYDDPALNPLIAPQYEQISDSIQFPEETGMRVVLHSFDPECNRSDPHGHGIDLEIEDPPTPCHVTVGLDDGEEPMGFTIWTTRKNGHYFRGIRHKPGVNGDHPVVIRVLDAPDLNARVLTETRSANTVRVYSPF